MAENSHICFTLSPVVDIWGNCGIFITTRKLTLIHNYELSSIIYFDLPQFPPPHPPLMSLFSFRIPFMLSYCLQVSSLLTLWQFLSFPLFFRDLENAFLLECVWCFSHNWMEITNFWEEFYKGYRPFSLASLIAGEINLDHVPWVCLPCSPHFSFLILVSYSPLSTPCPPSSYSRRFPFSN